MVCSPRWGTMPSADLKLPPEFTEAHPILAAAAAPAPRAGSGAAAAASSAPQGLRDAWYGF
jgi:hypothetical protein